MVDAEERDLVEGRYTQTQPEGAQPRRAHGKYTETDGHPGPSAEVVGAYVGTQRGAEPPLVRSIRLRTGNYPRSER